MPRTTPALIALALLPILATALALSSPTTLHINANEPPNTTAGTTLQHAIDITLEGPTDPTPGAATHVNLTLHAPPHTGCHLPDATTLDPITGTANATLTCTPTHTGDHAIHVTAQSPPHQGDTWTSNLTVAPDALHGSLTLDDAPGYQIPATLHLDPHNLQRTNATITLAAHLKGSTLGTHEPPHRAILHPNWAHTLNITAPHGPGTYTIDARIEGPHIQPLNLTQTTTLQPPPNENTTSLNVTVEPGDPHVKLTDETVNNDGVQKWPGDGSWAGERLITRVDTANAHDVNITVHRSIGDHTLTLAKETRSLDPAGDAIDHTFSHPYLPEGLLYVTAQAGESQATRTAQIQDAGTTATVDLPPETLNDGRTLQGSLTLHDENHGSTSSDPGPVWGLPDIEWKIFRGSIPVEGWNVAIGPFKNGTEGFASTSTIPWPNGTTWAETTLGASTLPLNITPPQQEKPGSYRISTYEANGDLIGAQAFNLHPAPTIDLATSQPTPGQPFSIDVAVHDELDETTVTLTVTANEEEIEHATIDGPGTVNVTLPRTVPARSTLNITATGDWPGRPATSTPDAKTTHTVPTLVSKITMHPSVDGERRGTPLALHPGQSHTIHPHALLHPTNAGPFPAKVSLLDPQGEPTGWATREGDSATIDVPKDPNPGRYTLLAQAPPNAVGVSSAAMSVDVGEVMRVAITDARDVSVGGGHGVNETVRVVNTGTVTVDRGVLVVDAPAGIEVGAWDEGEIVKAGDVMNWGLMPGEARDLVLHVAAEPDAVGDHAVTITAAGVAS